MVILHSVIRISFWKCSDRGWSNSDGSAAEAEIALFFFICSAAGLLSSLVRLMRGIVGLSSTAFTALFGATNRLIGHFEWYGISVNYRLARYTLN